MHYYKSEISYQIVDDDYNNQRIDNFLFNIFKDIPRSRIYKSIRSGEIRVNKSRVSNIHRLVGGDIIRIPPFYHINKKNNHPVNISNKFLPIILYEDDYSIIIDKPPGLAVHGGSGISIGLIEQLRNLYNNYKFLELCHRLDRDTSGIIIVAKKRKFLLKMHEIFREGKISKYYMALVHGDWVNSHQHIKYKLTKWVTKTGERRVKVDPEGKTAHTIVSLRERFGGNYSLLDIELCSGRTHQIRVHLSHSGFPIIGDTKYGSSDDEKKYNRLYLHAYKICFTHPINGKKIEILSDLPNDYNKFIKNLN